MSQLVEQSSESDTEQWKKWDENEVQQKLRDAEMPSKVTELLSRWHTRGKDLKHLTNVDVFLREGVKMQDCFKFLEFLDDHGCTKAQLTQNLKVFNDPVHGNIQLHPACVAVIDTPQFQRLRYLKQLGPVYFVYPGAAHNRFEHCIGVCYLAGQFVRRLRENQSYLGITDIDCLCVELAGLCHDLGHGPFSHLFDQKFIPAVLPGRPWKHEEASAKMFEYLVEKNDLMKEGGRLRECGLKDHDIIFILEQIAGPRGQGSGEWPYTGRPKEKAFLYEIVANKRNGIDVDKWDYLARDCHLLGYRNNFDHGRFMKFARVNHLHGEMQICIRDKEVVNLYYMLFTRYNLHMNAYQHKVSSALEMMIAQVLIKANEHVTILGTDGKRCKISECIDDMAAYTLLTDDVLFKILDTESDSKDMLEAKELINRIFRRDFYKCVYQHQPISTNDFHELFGTEDPKALEEDILAASPSLQKGNFFVQIVHKDFGMKDENPVEKLNVYSKNDPDKTRPITKDEISKILAPHIFKEFQLRIYSCDRKKDKCDSIVEAFTKWKQEKKKQRDERQAKEGREQETA